MTAKLDRRHVIAGGVAFLGATMFGSRVATAFHRGAAQDFRQASRILHPYGMHIAGARVDRHDEIRLDVVPDDDTSYVQTVKLPAANGELQPSIRTAYFANDATFTHFHPNASAGINPCVKTSILGHEFATYEVFDNSPDPCAVVGTEMLEGGHIGVVDFSHFHGGVINPCIKTTIVDQSLATHEVFDLSINPCVRVSSEMLEGGHIGTVDMTHFHGGTINPCVRTTIVDHALAIHELFDGEGINPCVRVSAEMLEGGHIGTVDFTHLHGGSINPCVKTTIVGHALATHAIFGNGSIAQVTIDSEMHEDGTVGAIDMNIANPTADLRIRVGDHTYLLRDGALVEVPPDVANPNR